MNLKNIKQLAQNYTVEQLDGFAQNLEQTGKPSVQTSEDLEEQMSDYLQAMEIRKLLDRGMELNQAIREFSKRVRSVL